MSASYTRLSRSLWALGLLALGAGAGYVARGRELPSAQAKSQAQASPGVVAPTSNKAELAALRARVAELEAWLRVANGAVAAQGAAPPQAEAKSPPVPPPTPEQEAAWLAARAIFYDQFLKNEPRDGLWAAPLEARAVTLAKQLTEKGIKLEDARCWSQHCRLEYSYPDLEARNDHVHEMSKAFPELGEASYAYPGEPQSHTRAVFYLGKTGQHLPDFDYASFIANTRQVASGQ
jgi:hypothetical protein